MKNKLKQLALILAAAMLFCTALTACGGGGGGGGGGTVTPKPTPGVTSPDYTVDPEDMTITAKDNSWVIAIEGNVDENQILTKTYLDEEEQIENQGYAVTEDIVTKDEGTGTVVVVRTLAIPRSALEALASENALAEMLAHIPVGDETYIWVTFTYSYDLEGHLESVGIVCDDLMLGYAYEDGDLKVIIGNASDLSDLWTVLIHAAASDREIKDFVLSFATVSYRVADDMLILVAKAYEEGLLELPGPTPTVTPDPGTNIVASGTCGTNAVWALDDTGTLTISGSGAMKEYTPNPPPWYSNRESVTTIVVEDGITEIAPYAFQYCDKATSAVISNSVTSIGKDAFGGCGSLETVTIPDSVTSIGDYAFEYSGLTSVEIPASVTSMGHSIFANCDDLVSVVLQDGLTVIGSDMFQQCSSLTSITIPGSITSIGYDAFYDCDSLTSVTFQEGVVCISSHAFDSCRNLTYVTIPESVTKIGSNAFYYCDNIKYVFYNGSKEQWNAISISTDNTELTDTIILYDGEREEEIPAGEIIWSLDEDGTLTISGTGAMEDYEYDYEYGYILVYTTPWDESRQSITSIVIEEGVERIGEYAFGDCKNVTSVTIPEGMREIGEHAFYRCSNLTSVTIPEGVRIIGEWAFDSCSNLTTVALPESIKEIELCAFLGSGVSEVYYSGSEEQWADVLIRSGNSGLTDATIYYDCTL